MSEVNPEFHLAHFHDGGPPELAGFWRRALAFILDLLIMYYPLAFAFCLPWLTLILLSEFMVIRPSLNLLILVLGLGIPLLFIACWMYSALTESGVRQGTFGKRIMGLRVIAMDGQPVTFLQATIRFWGKLISTGLVLGGYLIQPFNARKQTLHDILAGTLVVRKDPPEHQSGS